MTERAPASMTARDGPTDERLLRILHLVAPAPMGGIESVIQALAVGHRLRGHDVAVGAVLDDSTPTEGHPFLEALRTNGVAVHAIVVPARGYRRERALLRALLCERPVDVVHTHGYRPDLVDAPVARRAGAGVVTTLHGFIVESMRDRLYRWLQLQAARRADAVIAVSSPIAAQLPPAIARNGRLSVLPNAVPPPSVPLDRSAARAALDLPADGHIVGWVGRLSREKGPDVLMAALARTSVPVTAVLIGDGPMRGMLEAQARALGILDRVRFAGVRRDARRYLAAFDAFVLSSRTEGTPMALLEAMWADVPIVATRVGGVPDVVGAQEATLCASEDATGLATAIDRLCASRDVARAQAAAAARRVRDMYAEEAWLERHVAVYRQAQRRAVGRRG